MWWQGSNLDKWVCKNENQMEKAKSKTIILKMGEQKIIVLTATTQTATNVVSEIIGARKNDCKCHLSSKWNSPKTSAKT